LAYRGKFQGLSTNLINFYLEADFATSIAWEINNTIKKPPGTLALNYEYVRLADSGEKLQKYSNFGTVFEYYITNRHEAMSYACNTWGKVAGAWGTTAGAINSSASVNLGTAIYQLPGESQSSGFGNKHSGQFNANIQSLKPFYDEFLRQFDIPRNP